MNANYNATLSFKVDSSQARKDLQSLTQEIDKLSTRTLQTSFTRGISEDMRNASREVNKFSSILKEATNTSTGKLDLSQLSRSLKSANMDLGKVSQSFKALGTDGVKAFAGVVKQINAADVPIRKTSALVDKMWDNLKKTAGWQISSSMIHGLMRGVSSAFRYSQDLNKSLNNIRIVTGYNVDEMAKFAAEANKAAKALNSTTTEYTDASLIYFQQGLSKDQVKERADITIKMANVTRQSATEVSNQLTSIWNNFDDGTKSLEYYADVLTKLGAATASSTDEIAGGLEKFAAVADTIGLSYEYAASALATITSNTRQSEEVVGTALKTIFARIQGLNLGETLDDGTTLNKYSEALETVGINIIDSNGQLKKMDDILDELGSKWQTLSKNQQVALAQTVAGVRQYNQLISLMDNWNSGDSDSMAANLATARGATGELQNQADVYAESWEAAQKKVQASMESLYTSLLDDKFFIKLLNIVSEFVDMVNNLVGGLGGVRGLLATISTYIFKIAGTKISDELKRLTGPSQKKQELMAQQTKEDANKRLREIASAGSSHESKIIAKSYTEISNIQDKMRANVKNLSEGEIKIFQGQLDQLEVLNDIVSKKAKIVDLTEKENKKAERQLQLRAEQSGLEELQSKGGLLNRRSQQFTDGEINQINTTRKQLGLNDLADEQKKVLQIDNTALQGAAKSSHLQKYKQVIAEINAELSAAKEKMLGLTKALQDYRAKSTEVGKMKDALQVGPDVDGAGMADRIKAVMDNLSQETKEAIAKIKIGNKDFNQLVEELKTLDAKDLQDSIVLDNLNEALDDARTSIAITTEAASGIDMERLEAIDGEVDAVIELERAQAGLQEEFDKTNGEIDKQATKIPSWQDSLVNTAMAVSSLSMAMSALGGILDVLKDPEMSGWEKFTTVLTTLATTIPGVIMGIRALQEAKIKDVIINAANTVSEKLLAKAKQKTAEMSDKAAQSQNRETSEQQEDIITDGIQGATEGKGKFKFTGLKGMFGKTATSGATAGAGAGGTGAAAASGAGGATGAGGAGALTAGGASLLVAAGLIVATIAVIVGAVAWGIHQANAAERAVEKAKKTANELNTVYEDVKNANAEFNQQVNAYEDASKEIDKMTVGTEAYTNAVRSANEAAMELLETNKNLKYEIKDGRIVIDPESMAEQKRIEQEKVERAMAAKIAGQNQVRQAEEDLQKRNMARTLNSTADNDEHLSNIHGAGGAGAAAGALIGTLILPGVGTAIGAGIGAVAGALIGGIATDAVGAADESESEALEKLEAAYREDNTVLQRLKDGSMTDADWDKIGIEDEALRASLQENAEEVAALVGEMSANTDALNAQNDLVAANTLVDNEAVQKSDYKDQIIDIAGDAYGVAYENALNSDWADTWGKDKIAQIDGANEEAKKVFGEYLKYAGLEGQGFELTDTTGNDDNRKFVYKDKEGKEHTVSLEAMQAARAAYEASNTLNDSATKLATVFETLAGSANEASAAMLSFLSKKNFEGATKGEFEDMQSEVGSITRKEDGTLTDESSSNVKKYLEGALGENLTDEVAVSYGYKSAEAMIEAFASKMESADKAWDSIQIPDKFKFADKLSLGAAKALEKQMKNINLGPLGEKAGQEYVDQLNAIISTIDVKDQKKALEQLTSIDWSRWDAAERAKEIMEEFGAEIDTTSDEWDRFVERMRKANIAVPDFSKLKQDLQEIYKILQNLEFGSTISEEDYQKLGKDWQKFFMLQADGTRKFIGSQEDLLRFSRDQLKDAQVKMAEDKKHADKLGPNALSAWDDAEIEKSAGGDGKDGLFRFAEGDKATNTVKGLGYTVDKGKVFDKDGKEITQEEASKVVMANQRGITAENLINGNADIQAALEHRGYDTARIQEIIATAKAGNDAELQIMMNGLKDLINTDYEALGLEYEEMLASTATSLADLDNLSKDNNFSPETQQKALIGLASSYEECRDEVIEYQEALNSGDQNKIAKAEKNLRKALRDSEWKKATKAIKGYYNEIKNLKDTEEIAQKQKEIANELNNLFGSNVTSAFVKEHWDLFEEWSNATGDRATELALEIQQKAVMASEKASDILESNPANIRVDIDGDGQLDSFTDRFAYMKAIIEANPITINADGKADMSQLVNALMQAGFTAQEVANHLASIGMTEIEIEGYTNGQPIDLSTPEGMAAFVENFRGGMKVTSANVPSAGIADMSNYAGGGGGGGGSKKKAEEVKRSDTVERYKEVTDALDNNAEAMEEAANAADRLYGEARLAKMREANKLLEKEIELTKQKRKEAEGYLQEDKSTLEKVMAEVGVNFTFDQDTGDITNYTAEMNKLHDELAAAIDAANKDGNADEKEQEKIDAIQERIDKIKEAVKDYETTKEEIEDLDQEIQNQIYEWQDNNYEQLTYELEIQVEINDSKLELVEYYLEKIESDIYKTAEAFGYLKDKVDIYNTSLAQQESHVAELEQKYYAGKISLADYKAGLKDAQSATIENLQALQEQKEAMQDYYGTVMDKALEEIAIYTEQMEQLNSVLDHYSSILELVGKQEDYATKGKVLNAKATNLRNEMKVQQELYEKSNAEAEKWAAKMATAIEGSNEYETYKKNWQVAQQAANDAQESMLSKTEEWAEAMKAVVENELAGLAKTMEETLTGGTSFDELLTSMERRSSLQEEYLTTTNQIYETNKLMRQAQQEIDKSSNSVAKRKLQNFINETAQMQQQDKLSQHELDIQQAKYDLLLAEIALEEAQNAKSTVRLSRDSEGNFGYVYTADQGAVGAAEQELADKQNALYNLGLEGANNYSQKYAETMQEAQDAITELTQQWMNGEIASEEEYQRRKSEIQDYYYEKLKQYSSLYQISLTTDSSVIKDAWSTDFGDMTYKTEDWKNAVGTYFEQAASSFDTWKGVCATVMEESGLDDIETTVGNIVDKSSQLTEILIGDNGVVNAMMSEATAAGELSEAYITVQNEIDAMIDKYEELLEKLNADYTADTPVVEPGISTEDSSNGNNANGSENTAGTQSSGNSSGQPDGKPDTKPDGGPGTGPTFQDKDLSITFVYQYGGQYHGKYDSAKSAATAARASYHDDTIKVYNTSLTSFKGLSGGKISDLIYEGTVGEILGPEPKKQPVQEPTTPTVSTSSGVPGGRPGGQYGLRRVHFDSKSKFDTGGYTGDWEGSYGKLAILHSKELVLNAQDTENLLASMSLLDEIVAAIDLYSMNSQLSGALSSPSLGHMGDSGEVLEQQVHIEASFPGVQDRNEIEEAFNTLINRASQYANRK